MDKFEQQYQSFKDECMSHESGWIYNRFYEIGFYENIHDAVNELGNGEDEATTEFHILVNEGKLTLAAAFDEYLDQTWTHYDDWEDFSQFLVWITDKYNE